VGQISAYQEAPYQGVSQAPPQVRRRDQAEALEDCLVAIPEGLQKRPPLQYVGTLANHPGATNGVFHRVERLAGDALYTITLEGGVARPRVYDLATLAAQALAIDATAQTYLNATLTNPQHDIGCLTVVDYTFTWNRTKATADDGLHSPARNFEALIWVRAGAYARTYEVLINGVSKAKITTPNGTSASDGNWVGTDTLASALVNPAGYTIAGTNGATAVGAGISGVTVAQYGSVLHLTNATDFTVEVKDDQGGIAMVAAKDKVQKFSDLPQKAPDGFTVRIVQQSGTEQDDFFVKFSKTAGDGTGVWEECLAPNALLGLDKNTMPQGLVYDSGWKLKTLAWKQRTTGNEDLVKSPDFVGQQVQETTFWQGRLGIVSGEGVTLSTTDDPFQLYPRTLSTVVDSDPIGRVNPAPGETTFRYAIPFEGRLVLCGDNIQAQVTYDGVLTPLKASIDVMTQHEMNHFIRPAAVNGKLYLAAPKGTAASIIEISVDRVTNVPVGEDLTTAAFRYLPASIDRSAVCPVRYMAAYGVSGSSEIYCHLFLHSDQERVQNAFMRWNLPTGYALGGIFFANTTLYVLACAPGQGHVLKMDLSPFSLDADVASTIYTYLDLKASEAQVTGIAYNSGTDRTTMTLPYPRTDLTAAVARAPGTVDIAEGTVLEIDWGASTLAGANKLVLVGDVTAVPFYVGHTYRSEWELSRIYPLDGNHKPLRNGRCQLRRINVDLAETGYIRAEVTVGGRPTQNNEFFGFRFDDPASRFDTAPHATVRWDFPVMGENEQATIKLVNDSPFGYTVLGFEWVGEFNPKSQRT
jgi:hypothetical protein